MRRIGASRSTVLVAVAAVGIALAACSGPATSSAPTTDVSATGEHVAPTARVARIAVVASTNVYGNIAATIGGPAVSVTSIIDRPDADPHAYQADARTRLALQRADVVIENGGGYDDFVDTLRQAGGPSDATVVNAVALSGHEDGSRGGLNEHVWYDLPTMRALAGRLTAVFSQRDPEHAQGFAKRAKAFESALNRLIGVEASLAHRYRGTPVAITEPLPVYLLSACGLVNLTPPAFSEAVEEGIDVSPRVLSRTLRLFDPADPGVSVLIQNIQTDDAATRLVRQAASEAGVPVVPVTETLPAGLGYLDWMRGNLHALRTALGS